MVQPLALRTAHNHPEARPLASHSSGLGEGARSGNAGTLATLRLARNQAGGAKSEAFRHRHRAAFRRARALTASIVTFGARRPHWREVVLSSSCASERARRSPQCGGSRDCQSPLQWRRVLPCLVKLPEQGVCVGLLLPPLGAAHAEMQQLGAVWGCWMWCLSLIHI